MKQIGFIGQFGYQALPFLAGEGGGRASYVAQAVHFNGTVTLANASLSTSSVSVLSWAGWFKGAMAPNDGALVCTGGSGFTCQLNGEGCLIISLASESGRTGVITDLITDEVWHHVLFCGRTDAEMPETNVLVVVVDGVVIDAEKTYGGLGPFEIDLGAFPIFIGSDGDGNGPLIVDVADLWFAPGVSLLDGGTIPLGTIRKFIDAEGKPVDLGVDGSTPTGTAPAMFFSGDAIGFASNKGTGGVFILTGTLIDADASEPVQVGGGGGGALEWLLAAGAWNDTGVWDDAAVWKDTL
jgi:hypothetical protein